MLTCTELQGQRKCGAAANLSPGISPPSSSASDTDSDSDSDSVPATAFLGRRRHHERPWFLQRAHTLQLISSYVFFPLVFAFFILRTVRVCAVFFFMRTHLNRSNPQSMRQQHIYVGRFAVMRGLIGGKGRWWAGFCKGLTCVAKGKPPIPIRKRGLALLKLDSPGPRLIPSFLGIKWPKFKSIFCLLIILWRIGAFFLFFRRIAKYVHMYEIAFVLADVEFPPLSSFSCAFSRDRYRNCPEIPVAYSEAETESEALKECQLYHKAVSLQKGFANNFITHLATWT